MKDSAVLALFALLLAAAVLPPVGALPASTPGGANATSLAGGLVSAALALGKRENVKGSIRASRAPAAKQQYGEQCLAISPSSAYPKHHRMGLVIRPSRTTAPLSVVGTKRPMKGAWLLAALFFSQTDHTTGSDLCQ